MQWYACKYYVSALKKKPETISKWEIEGLERLISFLTDELYKHSVSDKNLKKMAKQNIPPEFINVKKLVDTLTSKVRRHRFSSSASNKKIKLKLQLNNSNSNQNRNKANNIEDK